METSYEKFIRVGCNLSRVGLIIMLPVAMLFKNWGMASGICLILGLSLMDSSFKVWKKAR